MHYKFFLFIALCSTLIFCNSSELTEEEKKRKTQDSVEEIIKKSDAKFDSIAHAFPLKLICAVADSFFISTMDFVPSTSASIDKIDKSYKDESIMPLVNSGPSTVERYNFNPGEGHKLYRFSILKASFTHITDSDNAFKKLKTVGGKDGVDTTPGLTYANDYLVCAGNDIYWVNTGCSYSYATHKSFAKTLLSYLHLKNITDSITCKCGVDCDE